jgi:hypothetical protein
MPAGNLDDQHGADFVAQGEQVGDSPGMNGWNIPGGTTW